MAPASRFSDWTRYLMEGRGPFPVGLSVAKGRGSPMMVKFYGTHFRRLLGPSLVSLIFVFMLSIGTMTLFHAIPMIDRPFAGFLYYSVPLAGSFGDYEWPGFQAGVQYRDLILEVNNQKVTSGREIDEIVMRTPVGEKLQFLLERDGQRLTLSIPVTLFTWQDVLKTFGPSFLMGVVFCALGIIVYVLKRDTGVSWAFLMLCFFVGTEMFSGISIQTTYASGFFLPALNMSFVPAAAFHLSLLFPEKTSLAQRHPGLQYLPYGISGILTIIHFLVLYALTEGPLTSEQILADSAHQAKIILATRVFALLGLLSLVSASLYAYWRSASTVARQRARISLWGSAAAFFPFVLGMPLVAVAKVVIPVNLMVIPTLFFPASIGYAIGRHNLFDVDVYIKRAVGYLLMTLLVGAGYFVIQTVLRTVVLDPLFGAASETIYPLVFALLVVFLFHPAHQAVQDLVDRIFFRKKFDYKATVNTVSNALASLLNQEAILTTLIGTIREQMFVDSAGVLLADHRQGAVSMFFMRDESGSSKPSIKESSLPLEKDSLLALVSQEKKLITKYDVAEDPEYEEFRESCGRRFTELGASLAIPLIHQNEVKGVLALGYKKSGNFYAREDIQLLETLANQGAVAIENARLAEQMQKEEMVRTNLVRYLSPQIVDQIIDKDVQVNLGGDRKVVTVLFSDIRNFTTISETMPPDQLVTILNEYFTEMARIIFANQGSLDKFIGDAIVAVFGSLIPLENSAVPAAQAAIQMMQAMPILNEKWEKDLEFHMNIGIGLDTGEVFLGNLGSPERMEFTVIGDTVNVASRFSGLAKPGEILMTRDTLGALGQAIPYEELPPAEVKGKSGKLEVFKVSYTCT